MTIEEVPQQKPRRDPSDLMIKVQVLLTGGIPVNTSTHHHGSRANNRKPGTRKLGHRGLVAGAIIAVCAGGGFAQTSILTTAPPAEDAATRQRRATTEVSNNEVIIAARVERPPALRTERRIFVRSKSLLVCAAVVEDKLLKRPEFRQLGFVLTRDESDADLILELRHDLFTMYVFIVFYAKTSIVIMGGKLSSLGGTVAGKVAKRFVKEMPLSAGP